MTSPSRSTGQPLFLDVTGKSKIVRELEDKRGLLAQMRTLLEAASFGGTFNLEVTKQITGSRHTQGLILGSPLEHRRAVEIKWQGGGNDSRMLLLLNVPHGMSASEVHGLLGKAQKSLQQKEQNVTKANPPEQKKKSLAGSLDRVMKAIVAVSISSGVVTKHACVDVIASELNYSERVTAEEDFASLLKNGHLEALEHSEEFVRINSVWLEKNSQADEPGAQTSSSHTVNNDKADESDDPNWREKVHMHLDSADKIAVIVAKVYGDNRWTSDNPAKLYRGYAVNCVGDAIVGNPTPRMMGRILQALILRGYFTEQSDGDRRWVLQTDFGRAMVKAAASQQKNVAVPTTPVRSTGAELVRELKARADAYAKAQADVQNLSAQLDQEQKKTAELEAQLVSQRELVERVRSDFAAAQAILENDSYISAANELAEIKALIS